MHSLSTESWGYCPSQRVPTLSQPFLAYFNSGFLLADYLVLITGRSPARGRMNGHTIYLATEFRVLPIATPSANTLVSHPVERHLVTLVEKHLSTSVLWFSYGWDLTRSLQAQAREPSDDKALWETVRSSHRIFLRMGLNILSGRRQVLLEQVHSVPVYRYYNL